MNIRLMQLIGLRRLLPKSFRAPVRVHWNRLLGWEQYARERSFYRRLIRKGDLVFDVGANVGGKTAAFLSLGARVIAVELNSSCVDQIVRKYDAAIASGRLQVECAAVASKSGELTLTIFDSESAIGSGSAEFVRYAETAGYTDSRLITTKAVTLDDLVARFGQPEFVKIDVEGMDADVLQGLTRRPRLLSFEYHTAAPLWTNTRECFNQAERLGFREANLTEMAIPKFLFPSWIRINDALSKIEHWHEIGDRWGDVIVR
jgi:FkbM family methyltransferase